MAELLKSARGPRQTSSKRFTFSWIWRARPHPRMCSRSPRCRNQINTLMPWIPSPIWEEEAKRPFLEFTEDYQTTTNLDWRWLSQRGGPGRSAAALQGRKGRGLWGTSTLPARGSGSGSWCALSERSWTACRQHHSPKYTKHESYKRLHGARPAGSSHCSSGRGVPPQTPTGFPHVLQSQSGDRTSPPSIVSHFYLPSAEQTQPV